MKVFKWFIIVLGFIFFQINHIDSSQVKYISDVVASFSGLNAMPLHFSIFMSIQFLLDLDFLKNMNSEYLIRVSRKEYIKGFLMQAFHNSFIFLFLLYTCLNVFILYYFDLEFYRESYVIIPSILSLCLYTLIYMSFHCLFCIVFIFINRYGLSLLLTTIISILMCYKVNLLSYLCIYEEYFTTGIIIIQLFLIVYILCVILMSMYFLLKIVFIKKDLIYEDEV